MKYIVTHPGKAHLDDYLSCCLALEVYGPMPVYRREPMESEMDDVEVLVLDVSGRYDPELRNFDHHQISPEKGECALSLWTREIDMGGCSLHELLKLTVWYQRVIDIDCRGPFRWGGDNGVSKDAMNALLSPVEGVLLSQFEKEAILPRPMLTQMREIGCAIIEQVRDTRERQTWLDENVEILEVENVQGIRVYSSDTTGTQLWRKKNAPQAAFSISDDDRGPGHCLFRYDDDPRIDFSQLAGPEIEFAHKGGFIAKTKTRLPPEKLELLVRLALI